MLRIDECMNGGVVKTGQAHTRSHASAGGETEPLQAGFGASPLATSEAHIFDRLG